MFAVVSGMLAGLLHVVAGPDHTAAVAPLSVRSPDRAPLLGLGWGVGHAVGTMLWLAIAWLLRGSSWLSLVSDSAELLVGLSLIALALSLVLRGHGHSHRQPRSAHVGAALGFGLLHGTAGASHLVGALPALGLSAEDAATYTAGYLFSSVLAMLAISALAGSLGRSRLPRRWLETLSVAAALITGCLWIVQFAI